MEEVLAAHKDVAECAVVGVHDQLKGEVPVGFVVLKSGVQRDETELVRELCELVRERIGPVAFFKQAAIVGKLPKTRSGKILRGTIRKIADGIDYAMPPTIEDRRARRDDALAVAPRLRAQALACLPPRTYPLTERRVALADGASAVRAVGARSVPISHTSARSMRRRACERACACSARRALSGSGLLPVRALVYAQRRGPLTLPCAWPTWPCSRSGG